MKKLVFYITFAELFYSEFIVNFLLLANCSFYYNFVVSYMGLPGGSDSKKSFCSAGDLGLIPGLGRSPGRGHGNHPSILAWRIPWTEEPGGPQSMGSQRVRHDWPTKHSTLLWLGDSLVAQMVLYLLALQKTHWFSYVEPTFYFWVKSHLDIIIFKQLT